MIIPTLLVVRKIQNLMWLKKISSIFFRFFWNLAKSVSKLWNSSKKKVTVLILPCVAWNWIKMDPSISGLVWFNMGSFRSQVFSWLFFLTQFFFNFRILPKFSSEPNFGRLLWEIRKCDANFLYNTWSSYKFG